MEKIFRRWILLICLVFITFIGCNNVLPDNNILKKESERNRNSDISKRVGELKNAGFFDTILTQTSRSVQNESNKDFESIRFFIENTDNVLDEIAQAEDAEIQMAFLDVLFNGGTVGEIADIMAQISPEMSQEYLDTLETLIVPNSTSLERSLNNSVDIRNIRIGFYDTPNTSRGLLDANFKQDTINWYYGLCATTIAGLSAYRWVKWWKPWVGVAGLVTAAAGGASMTAKLAQWYNCADFKNWVNALVSAYNNSNNFQSAATTANKLLGQDVGVQLLQISIATTGVVVFCATITPEVFTFVINTAKNTWNNMISFITGRLPSNVILSINGIRLIRI